jgi:hypothetical protein
MHLCQEGSKKNDARQKWVKSTNHILAGMLTWWFSTINWLAWFSDGEWCATHG